jgi:hypothetical protein
LHFLVNQQMVNLNVSLIVVDYGVVNENHLLKELHTVDISEAKISLVVNCK